MMKKLMMLILSGVSVIALSGCGGGSSDYYETPLDVNYLTDDLGFGINGIYYECASGYSGFTGDIGGDGDFDFDPTGDSCDFYLDNMIIDLYIMDEFGGVNGLYYDCFPSGIFGITGDFIDDGGFDYDTDDICTISY